MGDPDAAMDNMLHELSTYSIHTPLTRTLRARPAHALSHETPAKKINTIFCYLARQRDHPVHFAAVTRENIARNNPAKNKNRSRAVFFVAALGKIFLT